MKRMLYQSPVNRNLSRKDATTLFYLIPLHDNAISMKVTVDFLWFIICKTED